LTGGDRTSVEFNVEAGARGTLTTQAAEKLYRALPGAAPVHCAVSLRAGANAWAEWLAQETILFNGARLRRAFSAELAPGSRMLAVESIVFGRQAMGEELRMGMLHDSWRIRLGGRLIWADALRLDGDIMGLRQSPFAFSSTQACTTLLYVGPGAAALLDPVRAMLEDAADGCGATVLDELLIIRLLDAHAPRLRARVVALAGLIRHLSAGLSRTLPRVWHC
jgi:urease accessory protein